MLNTNNKNMYPGYDNNVSKEQYNTLVNRFNELKNYVTTIITGKEYEFTSNDKSITLTTTNGNKVKVDFKVVDDDYIADVTYAEESNTLFFFNKREELIGTLELPRYVHSIDYDSNNNEIKPKDILGNVLNTIAIPNNYVANVDYNVSTGTMVFKNSKGEPVDSVELPNEGTLKDVIYDNETNEFVYMFSTGQEIRLAAYEKLVFNELTFSSEYVEDGRELKSITINGDKWNLPLEVDLSGLEASIAAIESSMNSLGSSLRTLIEGVTGDLSSYKDATNSRLSSIENTVSTHTTSIKDLSDYADELDLELSKRILDVDAKISPLQTSIDFVNTNITNFGVELGTIKSNLNLLQESTASDIASIENRLSNLEDGNSIDSYTKEYIDSLADELSTDIQNLENEVYDLKGDLSANYYAKTYIDSLSNEFSTDIQNLEDEVYDLKVDLSDNYYTKDEVDGMLENFEGGGGGSADLSNYYNKQQVDALVEEIYSEVDATYAKQADLNLLNTKVGTVENMINTLNGEVV